MPPLDPNLFPDGIANSKQGNVWTASMHIFCAIVGAGVLALPSTFVNLGWVAGPILIVVFFAISMLTSFLLIDVYQVDGIEFPRYHLAVRYILTRWESYGLSLSQLMTMVLGAVAYTVSPATAMKRIAQLSCQLQDKAEGDCWDKTWKLTLIFGAVQVPLAMVPNIEQLWFVSAIGAVMSVIYSTIALGLGLHYASNRLGTVGGNSTTPANKAFNILSSLGAIAFAYAFHVILVEIQDTIRQPPKASKTMKKATFLSVNLVFFYYLLIAIGGYASLGNDAPSYIFAGYTQAPDWVMIFGNAAIIVHMVSAFQLFSQPVYNTIETNFKYYILRGRYAKHARTAGIEGGVEKASPSEAPLHANPTYDDDDAGHPDVAKSSLDAPGSDANATEKDLHKAIPTEPLEQRQSLSARLAHLDGLARKSAVARELGRLSRASAMYRASTGLAREDVEDEDEHPLPLILRFVLRTAYVVAITVVACCLPFFSDIAGLVGAVTFWPLSVYFPIAMWRKIYKPTGWFNALLVVIMIVMFLVAVGATIGSIRSIVESSKNYTVFGD